MSSFKMWDLVINDGSDTHGFMLAPDGSGKKPWIYKDTEVIAPRQLAMGSFTDSEFPPLIELPLNQEDWRVGLGRTKTRLDRAAYGGATLGYKDGVKVDASGDSIIKLGPGLTATTVDDATGTTKGPQGYAAIGAHLWHFMNVSDGAERDRFYTWDFTDRDWLEQESINNGRFHPNGVQYGANVYVPRWGLGDNTTSTVYMYTAAGTSWTHSTLSVSDFYFMAQDSGGTFYGGYRPASGTRHHVYYSTNPTNSGSWTGAVAIGQSDSDITALVPYKDLMLICKSDGLYTINSSGTVVDLDGGFFQDNFRHTDNFRNAINFQGRVLLPLGEGGMYELDDSSSENLTDISFRLVAPGVTKLDGEVVSLAAGANEVYALVREGTALYFMLGEYLVVNGVADYRWHQIGQTTWTGTAIDKYRQVLYPYSILNGTDVYKRIWQSRFGTAANRAEFWPRTNDRDLIFTPDNDATIDLTEEDAFLPQVDKNFLRLECETSGLGTGGSDHNIPIDYSLDAGASFSSLGTLTASSQTLTFTAGTNGKSIILRAKPLQGSTTTTTPKLLGLRLICQVRPDPSKLLPVRILLGDNIPNKTGAKERKMKTKLAKLREWNDLPGTLTIKSAFKPAGDDYLALPGQMQEERLNERRGHRDPQLVDMTFLEV